MNKKQIFNILKVSIIAIIFMLVFEILFSFDSITSAISDFIASFNSFWVYFIIYLIMVVQVCFIPLPVYIVINAAVVIESIDLSLTSLSGWIFILVTMLAYMTGVVIAYVIGYKYGKFAVKWCAGSEEDYNKWVNVFNKKGKWYYALTVLLPIFPDDLLCFVAGSVKLNFWFYFISNFICRFIGLVCLIISLQFVNTLNKGGFPTTLVGWTIALFVVLVLFVILGISLKRQQKKN